MVRKTSKAKATSPSFLPALKELCAQKGIDSAMLFDAIEVALVTAYKKNFGDKSKVRVQINRDDGTYHVYAIKDVVDTVRNDALEISLAQAKTIQPDYEVGDIIEIEVTPANFGRIAAQQAKTSIMQKVREYERENIYDEFTGKVDDIVTGFVQHIENKNVFIDLGRTEALLTASEQIPGEEYIQGKSIKAYVVEVKKTGKGPLINVSRTHPAFLKKLFELNVAEIQDEVVEIKSVAREPGSRSKIAVYSSEEDIDPVGSCVGPKGIRVQAVTDELGAEKIDIVRWSEDPVEYIASALSPSEVTSVVVNEDEKFSRVIVPDNQLSLAIGKEGQNARLAAKLTGWKIDIKSESQAADESAY